MRDVVERAKAASAMLKSQPRAKNRLSRMVVQEVSLVGGNPGEIHAANGERFLVMKHAGAVRVDVMPRLVDILLVGGR
jgi:hypothetical protein